jgi:isopropylmalate/homocitrate/citramalate synthase
MFQKVAHVAKALAAAIVAGAAMLELAATDGTVTTEEWYRVVAAVLVALGGVWAVPNKSESTP